MILIAENIDIASNSLATAVRYRDLEPLMKMAGALDAADVDYLDINTGPASQYSPEMTMWLVKAVQSITGKPLSLHSADARALLAGLRISSNSRLINPDSPHSHGLHLGLALAREYNVSLVGSLHNTEGLPRNANDRGVRALDLVDVANSAGVPNERIWLDPVACPVRRGTAQIKAVFEFLRLVGQIAPGCKSVVELSRVSEGSPPHLRAYLNRTCLIMLMRYGLSAAIVDALDSELIEIARGRRPHLVYLVHRMMDGEPPGRTSVSPEEMKYMIMVRTLNGETLHARSRANAWKYSNCAA